MGSSLLGRPGDRWPLREAVDDLVDSARHAGVPGLVWIAGAFYPSLNLNVDLARGILGFVEELSGIEIPGEYRLGTLLGAALPFRLDIDDSGAWLLVSLVVSPLAFIVYRAIAGLARVSDPQLWAAAGREDAGSSSEPGLVAELRGRRSARLRTVWRAGAGLGVVALGLWLVLLFLLLGALTVLMGPLLALVKVLQLSEFDVLFAGLLLPVLLLVLLYAVVLMVLNQLALHSLAHNRRGMASALTHAWRLVRASPLIAARATLLELVLFGSVLVLGSVVRTAFGLAAPLASIGVFLLLGFAGVTRAGFWARTYRALGGLSSADRVPGL
jgi:hypothetical protein